MYRAATLKVMRQGIALDDEAAICEVVEGIRLEFEEADDHLRALMDGEDVTDAIRSPQVTRNIAPVCALRRVREVVGRKQREMGRNGGIVMEGRDIGTVVFARANVKIYLTASIHERARRRQRELELKGISLPLEQLEAEIAARDKSDQERDLAPLRLAPDAVVVDTTELSIEQQVERIVALAKDK